MDETKEASLRVGWVPGRLSYHYCHDFGNTIAKRLVSAFLLFKKIYYSDLIFAPIVMVQSTSLQPLGLILVENKKCVVSKKVDFRVPVLVVKLPK